MQSRIQPRFRKLRVRGAILGPVSTRCREAARRYRALRNRLGSLEELEARVTGVLTANRYAYGEREQLRFDVRRLEFCRNRARRSVNNKTAVAHLSIILVHE